jgi:hypothetical protein
MAKVTSSGEGEMKVAFEIEILELQKKNKKKSLFVQPKLIL